MNASATTPAPQWTPVELAFDIPVAGNPYLEVEGSVRFTHEEGREIVRPLFWDGGSRFKVRFASTENQGQWSWELILPEGLSTSSPASGTLTSVAATGGTPFHRHGFWTIPKGSRQLVHQDGTSAVLVADTPWALPWRATPEEVRIYAADRQKKGFNAALLMTVQPDMKAVGPRDRSAPEGFAVGFEDLPEGHLNRLNPDYFQELDVLMEILVSHGIAPVFQPVFHGYGWKGLQTAGNHIPPGEYARFCRYLVARYGASPAIWLVGGDGMGNAPGLEPGGMAIEKWDAYEHPTGLHYGPNGKTDSFQDADWLDFQWAQTGHNAEHLPEVVMDLYHQLPVKASANGEPTYENMSRQGHAAGWWQGHEAWSNLTAGGTMGVVYGAGSLWNWIHDPDEPGHAEWTRAPGCGWKEALDFDGSTYVGNIGKILAGYPLYGAQPNWRIAPARRGLFLPGTLFITYLGKGGGIWLPDVSGLPRSYRIYDPKTAEVLTEDRLETTSSGFPTVETHSTEPRVIIFFDGESARE